MTGSGTPSAAGCCGSAADDRGVADAPASDGRGIADEPSAGEEATDGGPAASDEATDGGPAATAGPSAEDRGLTVLHVDDEPGVVDLVARFLERTDDDLRVVTATSASEGAEVLADERVDCVVSDYDMPGDDGLAFCRTVKREDPELPFVLYTWRSRSEVAGEPGAEALDAHLQKEYDLDGCESLAATIRDVVEEAPTTGTAVADDD